MGRSDSRRPTGRTVARCDRRGERFESAPTLGRRRPSDHWCSLVPQGM